MSCSFLLKMRNASHRQTDIVKKIKTHFNDFFFYNSVVHEILWKNIVERGRPQTTIWRMRIACRIPKATNTHTHSQYDILTAFPPQQCLPESISMLRYTYTACTLSVTQVTIYCRFGLDSDEGV
jgi:hypothetical protein